MEERIDTTGAGFNYPYYWEKTVYPDHIFIPLGEPTKMDLTVKGEDVTLDRKVNIWICSYP